MENLDTGTLEDAIASQGVGFLLQLAHRSVHNRYAAALVPLGLSPYHFGVLLHLQRSSKLSQTQLVRRMGSDRTTMVRTVDDLEQSGYVTRTRSTIDRRVNEVTMTEQGATMLERAGAVARAIYDESFRSLDDKQIAELRALLTTVIADNIDT